MSRVKFQRNLNLVKFHITGRYTARSLGNLFKISHPRVLAIIKRYKTLGKEAEKKYKGRAPERAKTKELKTCKNL